MIFAAILALALGLRVWRLADNGFGTEYYAAGARSMASDWHLWFFNAFDPAGFLSLDKPPLAFWIQALSVNLAGVNWLGLLLPQALLGTVTVGVTAVIVSRLWGRAVGILAGLFLALTPVAVAVDRTNNTDSALALMLAVALWAFLMALRTGAWHTILGTAVLFGLAFNAKMFAALVPLSLVGPIYLWLAPGPLWQRLGQLAAAGVVVTAVSLSWAIIYDLTPVAKRPHVDSSQSNSMLDLILIHNGRDRFLARARPPDMPTVTDPNRFYDAVPVGPLRLADRHLAGQVGWLLPLALAALAAAAVRRHRSGQWSDSDRATFAIGGWAMSYALVFSLTGGIFHAYYLAVLGVPLAILAALGAVDVWRNRDRPAIWLMALGATMAWQVYLIEPGRGGSWRIGLMVALSMSVLGALIAWVGSRRPGLPQIGAGMALAGLLAAPAVWSLSVVLVPGNLMLPAASLDKLTRDGDPILLRRLLGYPMPTAAPKFINFLQRQQGNERFLLTTPHARLAAPIIVRTGASVLAVGGFSGNVPTIDVDGLAALAQAGELRFALVGSEFSFGVMPDDRARAKSYADWARRHQIVDPALWRPAGRFARGLELYDLQAPLN